MNTFSNDGSFMEQFLKRQKLDQPETTIPPTTTIDNKDTFDAASYYSQYGMEANNNNNYYSQYYGQQGQQHEQQGEYNQQYYQNYNQSYNSYGGNNQSYNNYGNQPPPPPQQQYGQQPPPQYGQQSNPGQPTKVLWAGNVHPEVMEEELRQIFGPFGYIEMIKVVRNKQYAFITFAETASAVKAQSAVNNQNLRGMALKLGFGKVENIPNQNNPIVKKEDDIPTRNLWLGNVHQTVSNDILKQLFEQFGRVDTIHILSHRGCAFVNFNSVEGSIAARQNLNGYVLQGMPLKINFRKENEHFNSRGGANGGNNDFNNDNNPRYNRSNNNFNNNNNNNQINQNGGGSPPDSQSGGPRVRSDRAQRSFTRGETVPLPVPPPSSHKEQQAIDKIADYIAKNGPKLESMIMERNENNSFFDFLKPNGQNNDYYRWKLWMIKNPDTHSNTNENTNQQQQQYLNEVQVSEFKNILQNLNPNNIPSCISWVMNHYNNSLEIISIITTTHQNNQLPFQHKLNILQVLNECLQSSFAKRENKSVLDEFAATIKPYLPWLIFSTAANENEENQDKVINIITNWYNIYPNEFIESELKPALQPDDDNKN